MRDTRVTAAMNWRIILLVVVVSTIISCTAFGAHPGEELWLPVAGHGPGDDGSFWVTDLYIVNPDDEEPVQVEITFLVQSADNSNAEGMTFEIEPGETLVLEDVVATLVGEQTAFGALHIEVVDQAEAKRDLGFPRFRPAQDEALEDEFPIMVQARVYDLQDDGTKGQSLEGIPSHAAISADGTATTWVPGVSAGGTFRSNWFGLNVSEDENDEPTSAEVMVEVLDTDGNVVASDTFEMPPLAPIFFSLSDLVTSLDDGTLRFTMNEGSGIFGASKIDRRTNDGTTLASFWDLPDRTDLQFTDQFMIESCTFTPTGDNPFFLLRPGLEIVLEGDDGGVAIEQTVEVLDETFLVDGVMTRVVTETELEDGDLLEYSRNFFAQCVETGDVFYFGEEVDIYEDGEIVSHAGAWLAGENGARAGIIMPGSPLVGSRYFQEVAPGVAMDRSEHVATGVTMKTEVGDFGGCLVTRDSTPLDPGAGDVKVYCPGIGIVLDGEIEVTEFTEPD